MDLLMKSQNSSTRKGPWKLGKQTRTHKMEVEIKKKIPFTECLPSRGGAGCHQLGKGRADHPKDVTKGASAEPSEAELETF